MVEHDFVRGVRLLANTLLVNTRDELVARIMNSAAFIKEERQNDLRRATRTIAKRVEGCIEVDGGIFEHLL